MVLSVAIVDGVNVEGVIGLERRRTNMGSV